jgi:hypothetical protein
MFILRSQLRAMREWGSDWFELIVLVTVVAVVVVVLYLALARV